MATSKNGGTEEGRTEVKQAESSSKAIAPRINLVGNYEDIKRKLQEKTSSTENAKKKGESEHEEDDEKKFKTINEKDIGIMEMGGSHTEVCELRHTEGGLDAGDDGVETSSVETEAYSPAIGVVSHKRMTAAVRPSKSQEMVTRGDIVARAFNVADAEMRAEASCSSWTGEEFGMSDADVQGLLNLALPDVSGHQLLYVPAKSLESVAGKSTRLGDGGSMHEMEGKEDMGKIFMFMAQLFSNVRPIPTRAQLEDIAVREFGETSSAQVRRAGRCFAMAMGSAGTVMERSLMSRGMSKPPSGIPGLTSLVDHLLHMMYDTK